MVQPVAISFDESSHECLKSHQARGRWRHENIKLERFRRYPIPGAKLFQSNEMFFPCTPCYLNFLLPYYLPDHLILTWYPPYVLNLNSCQSQPAPVMTYKALYNLGPKSLNEYFSYLPAHVFRIIREGFSRCSQVSSIMW